MDDFIQDLKEDEAPMNHFTTLYVIVIYFADLLVPTWLATRLIDLVPRRDQTSSEHSDFRQPRPQRI